VSVTASIPAVVLLAIVVLLLIDRRFPPKKPDA
jgi:hypothetical protein